MSNWPVRRKVALVVALPLLLAVVLGGLRVASALDRSEAATAAASQVTVLEPALAYLSAAEEAAMAHRDDDVEQAGREAAVVAVRAAGAELSATADDADLTGNQRALVDRALSGSESLRDGSAYASGPSSLVELGQLEADVSLLVADLAATGSPAERALALTGQLVEGRYAVTRLQLQTLDEPRSLPADVLYSQLGVESAVISNLLRALPDDDRVQLLRRLNASNQGAVDRGAAVQGGDALRIYDELAEELLTDAERSLAGEASGSRTEATVTAIVVGVALLIAMVLALLVSRALVLPLRRLRDGALEVANERLPETVGWIRSGHRPGDIEPLDVTTTEELGQVARAVDDLHRTAVRLAQGEAELRSRVGDMFVTLSRRSTSLVHQQLHLIEELERDEEDPERLENLFRLDHLASRMRRTAESLVVLADAPTQRSEQESLTVTEALHAAAAGVRDYQRVSVASAPAVRIKGTAAADVVHLLTELVDNALTYSPPDSEVTILVNAPSGMLLVEIRDEGVGIEHTTLEMLNRELRSGGTLTVEATKRMGLLVVSRLARRHGITVLLSANVDRGVTAQVFLPRPLLTGLSPVAGVPALAAPAAESPAELETPGTPEAPAAEEPADEDEDAPVEAPGWQPAAWEPPMPTLDPVATREDLSAETLSAVISANIGLPQRQPGATQPPAAGSLFPRMGDRDLATPRAADPAVESSEPVGLGHGERADGPSEVDETLVVAEDGPEDGPEDVADDVTGDRSEDLPQPVARPVVEEPARPAHPHLTWAQLFFPEQYGTAESQADADEQDVDEQGIDEQEHLHDGDEVAAEQQPVVEDADEVEPVPDQDEVTLADTAGNTEDTEHSEVAEDTEHAWVADDDEADLDDAVAEAEDAEAEDAEVDAEVDAEHAPEDTEVPDVTDETDESDAAVETAGADLDDAAAEVDTESDRDHEVATPELFRGFGAEPVFPDSEEPAAEEHVAAGDDSPAAGLPVREPAAVPLSLAVVPDLVEDHDEQDLGLPVVAEVEDDDEFDSPIFRQLRSSWFEDDDQEQQEEAWSPSEADEGWKAAERASAEAPRSDSDSGLPTRRPGDRLVPGGVSGSSSDLLRDPEAIKARLSAHANGVARGRAAAAGGVATPVTDEDEE